MMVDQGSSLADLTADAAPDIAYGESDYAAGDDADKLLVENRWGRFVFDRRQAITMPKGLPGFPDERKFALANLSDPRLQDFKLLQSLTNPTLSFLVAPLNMEASMLDPSDVDAALREHRVDRMDAAMLLIITVRKHPVEGVQMTANVRAPLVIDTANRVGAQHIFNNESYPIRFPLNLAA